MAAKRDAVGWNCVHDGGREFLICNECCGVWRTKKEKSFKKYSLNRVRGIMKTEPNATFLEPQGLGKATLNDFKRFASSCSSRGHNPQGWGDLEQQLNSSAKACSAGKEAARPGVKKGISGPRKRAWEGLELGMGS